MVPESEILQRLKKRKSLSNELLLWLNSGRLDCSEQDILSSGIAPEEELKMNIGKLVFSKLLIRSPSGRFSLTEAGLNVAKSLQPENSTRLAPFGVPFPKDCYRTPKPSQLLRQNSDDFLSVKSLLTSNQLFHTPN